MGSKTYPGENEFEEFVSQNGGGSNAYTEYESTTYYFHVKEDALYGALLRFAALLENPLLQQECMDREIKAIESEFESTKQNDDSAFEQLLYSLAKKEHLLNRFAWGNRKSLLGKKRKQKKSSKNQKKQSQSLLTSLRSFFNEHYTANSMTLVVASSKPVEELINSYKIALGN